MSGEYLNIDQLIEKLTEIRDTQKFQEDFPVYYGDSSGCDYYVTSVILKDGVVIIN